jgi:hypothetical protein
VFISHAIAPGNSADTSDCAKGDQVVQAMVNPAYPALNFCRNESVYESSRHI